MSNIVEFPETNAREWLVIAEAVRQTYSEYVSLDEIEAVLQDVRPVFMSLWRTENFNVTAVVVGDAALHLNADITKITMPLLAEIVRLSLELQRLRGVTK